MTTDILEIPNDQMVTEPMDVLQDEFYGMVHNVLNGSKKLVATFFLYGFLMAPTQAVNASVVVRDSSPVEILVDNRAGQLSLCDVDVCFKHHLRLNGDVDRLSAIKDGWDGMFAKAPSSEALDAARYIISVMDEEVLSHCAVFPSNDGGVYLQGRYAAGRMSIFLDGKTMTVSLRNRHGEKYQQIQTVNDQHLNLLMSQVNKLMQNEAV